MRVRVQSEPLIDDTEPPALLEFRDGKRSVPHYLARYMGGWETYLMTYDEAVAEVNRTMERDFVAPAMEGVISEHFKVYR